jgi:hypothetical protein
VTTHTEKRQQQHQAQHRTRDERQGELRHQFAEGLEDEELNEALNHCLSVDNLMYRFQMWGVDEVQVTMELTTVTN